jgi:succinate dehydrogenase/fumarate reductase cytochrome b subunit
MQSSEQSAAPDPEQVAHGRPAVERWLTLTGLVPLPVFLVLHLSRELVLSRASDISQLIRPQPSAFAGLTALALVWLPLAVHLALGAWLLGARRATRAAAALDVGKPALGVSRLASVLALLFVAYHAREYPLAVWLGEADARDAGFRLVARLSATSWGVPLRGGAYLLGLAATVAHSGLAVHRALLRAGWLRDARRRRRSAQLCAASSALLFMLGAAAVIRVASGALLN